MSTTPKIRFSPSASSASTPPSRIPLMAASARKIGSITDGPPPSESHVRLAHEILVGQLVGAPFHRDSTDLQQVCAIDQLQHLPHVLLDDEDRVALLPDAPDQI